MTKKRSHTQHTKQRNAERRAAKRRAATQSKAARRGRAAEQRRARRAFPRRGADRHDGGEFYNIVVSADGQVAATRIPSGEIESYRAYAFAHELLPPGHEIGVDSGALALALLTLDDPHAGGVDVLRAIMLLAHTPDERALEALNRYAESGSEHSAMAKHGADECALWLEELPASSPRPAPAQAMLN